MLIYLAHIILNFIIRQMDSKLIDIKYVGFVNESSHF